MSKKQKTYSPEFKTKVVLELLSGNLTVGGICSKHKIISKSLLNWKKTFLSNASLAFNADKAVSSFKLKLKDKEKEVNELHRQLGKRTAELEWASKKLKSLDFNHKKDLIQSKLCGISVFKQCKLLGYNRSSYYYEKVDISANKMSVFKAIDEAYANTPFYGYRKIHQQLLEEGLYIGVNTVRSYMLELGLKTIYPTKTICTTLANPKHKKYPYLLRNMSISKPNQVWSTDITYVKIKGGFVYLAAIIDWYSKAILSYKVSNTMDSYLVTEVLNEALEKYGAPEIFNTDQGSQYTSHTHTQILINHGIKISMDGKGRATDNIAIERFWRSAKYENIYIQEYNSIRELKSGIADYIKFYNYKRFHQSLNYKKPMDAYNDPVFDIKKMVAKT